MWSFLFISNHLQASGWELAKAKDEIEQKSVALQQSQMQLIQTEKMAAMGRMLAGVAHELNNPMMSILSFTRYCREHTAQDDERYELLQDTEREVKRCIDIVSDLSTFSRERKEGEEGRVKVSCAEIWEYVLRLASYRIEKEHVTVTTHFTDDIPKVRLRVNSIQQVFLNMLSNAMDALLKSKKKEIHIGANDYKDEYIIVTIADTGSGIAPENVQKIFDPFFTTKPTGEGTGLGLSICQSIIQEHGGKITCDSKPGEGTTFQILLTKTIVKDGVRE